MKLETYRRSLSVRRDKKHLVELTRYDIFGVRINNGRLYLRALFEVGVRLFKTLSVLCSQFIDFSFGPSLTTAGLYHSNYFLTHLTV